jgi:hypothetical protein
MKTLPLLCAVLLIAGQSAIAQTAATSAFIWGFQQGSVAVVDPVSGRILRTFAVRDRAGIPSVAVTSNGQILLVVDDAGLHMLDVASGKPLFEERIEGVLHKLGGGPYIHLTADDHVLLVRTYDLKSAAHGVLLFDVKNRSFAPVGLRGRACEDPEFASSRRGILFAMCPGKLQALKFHEGSGDFVEVSRTELQAQTTLSFAAGADGRVYVLTQSANARQLLRWSADGKPPENMPLPSPAAGRQDGPVTAHLAVSADSRTVAFLHDQSVWLLDAGNPAAAQNVHLPEAGSDLAFAAGGPELLVIAGEPAQLVRIDAGTATLSSVPVSLPSARGPRLMTTAPAVR